MMARIPQDDCVRLVKGADGSVYMLTSENTRPAEIAYQSAVLRARMSGKKITPEMDETFARSALAMEAKYLSEVRARGVAGNIRKLFRAKRKKEAIRYSKSIVIDHTALDDLIWNCGTLGLSHHSKHLEFVPESRELTDSERDALFSRNPSPRSSGVEKKVRQIFAEREHRSVHLFANDREWHCFYLSFRDIAGEPGTGEHHWSEGAHLHYVSHLFGRLTKEQVWEALERRHYSLPNEHIRYRQPDATKRMRRFLHADIKTGRMIEVPIGETADDAPRVGDFFARSPLDR